MLVMLLAPGCAGSARARKLAFIDAGLEIRKSATGQSYDDVKKELELFIERDIARVRLRARLQEEKDFDLYRKIWIVGSAIAVVAGTSGTLSQDGAAQGAVSGVGAVAALGGFVLWKARTKEMADCQAFLDQSETELRSWAKAELRGTVEPVPHEIWTELVAKTAAIQRHDRCLRARD